jgi:Arc/MetJ-type ribon-helix-helix transcriptional regulator
MRAIINISLPEPMALTVERAVATGEYATKSEFFRALLRNWSEQKLAGELNQSRLELKQGKGKLLRSLKDLR